MTALASRRRRNTVLALVAGIVTAVAAPTLLFVGAKAISNSTAGRNALANVPPEQSFPQTPTTMLATVSDSNELTSVTVFVMAPEAAGATAYDQRGGSVVSVPINIDPGSGEQLLSLHDAYALGGQDELLIDVQSALNLTIDSGAVMNRKEFAGFLLGLPPIQVSFVRDVLSADGSVLFAKGAATLSATQAAQVMTTRSPTEHERLRRPNLEALWAGIAKAVGTGRQGQTLATSVPTTFADTAARLMAGPVAARGLLTRALDASKNPEQLDVEALDRPDTILVFASIAPASMTKPATGLSFRIEAPPGYDQQVRKTISILLASAGNVVSVDLNAARKAETTFSIYDPTVAAAEPTDNPVFGTITIQTPKVRLGGVDETISLGTDYLDHVDLSAPDATSTSLQPTETTG